MVVGTIDINDDKKCRPIAGNFDHHADVAVQCGAQRPLEHIQSFTRSHWMPLYCPGGYHGWNMGVKHKTLTKQKF
jgi:hypothetical protein